MDGIQIIKDDKGKPRYVQIDLTIHEELWEDFYDLIIAEERKKEESIPFEQVMKILEDNNTKQNESSKLKHTA